MNGHPLPHRRQVGPESSSSRRHSALLPLLLVAMLAVLLAAALFMTGCGSEEAGDETDRPDGRPVGGGRPTTSAPTETTAAQAEEGTFPVTVTDDQGASVTISAKPMRIVSTAPANTETLFALGLADRIVGVTSLDDYPPEAAAVAKVGDFQVNTEAVMALSPDLVVGYAGNEEALAPVTSAGAPVLILDPTNLAGIYANIDTVGTATGAQAEAAELVEALKAEIKMVTDATAATTESPKVFYALDNTLWTAGPGSFVDELLKLVNATNVGSMEGTDSAAVQPYYQFAPEQLVAADPDVILLPNTAYTSIDEFVADPRFADLRAVKEGQRHPHRRRGRHPAGTAHRAGAEGPGRGRPPGGLLSPRPRSS